jgi:hypothetical protein
VPLLETLCTSSGLIAFFSISAWTILHAYDNRTNAQDSHWNQLPTNCLSMSTRSYTPYLLSKLDICSASNTYELPKQENRLSPKLILNIGSLP